MSPLLLTRVMLACAAKLVKAALAIRPAVVVVVIVVPVVVKAQIGRFTPQYLPGWAGLDARPVLTPQL